MRQVFPVHCLSNPLAFVGYAETRAAFLVRE
jgi:hypothetical protein